jgi:hypothetical protein
MHRRQFLTTARAGTSILAFPAVLRAQSKEPIRIGFPLPLTGTFAAIAADMQRGRQLAMEEINAKGGIMGRKSRCCSATTSSSRPSARSAQGADREPEGGLRGRRAGRARADGDQRADQGGQEALHLGESVRRDQRQADTSR